MDIEKAIIVTCITLFLVIGFNAAIYVSVIRKKRTVSQVELLRKATKTARKPWQKEDEALQELSDQVKKLTEDTDSQTEND